MKKIALVCIVMSVVMLSTYASADEVYRCTYGQEERVISVVYLDQQNQVPCEVRYEKDGVTQTLWNAESEVGYCEEKAKAFVEKQRGWGWICKEVNAE